MDLLLQETITYTQERCYVLKQAVDAIPVDEYPTDGPSILIAFIKEALKRIKEYLGQAEIFDLLKSEDAETQIKRCSFIIPYLYNLLDFVEGANIEDAPSALVQPFRRLIKKFIPDAEIIIRATSEFNFSFSEIASEIKNVFLSTPFSEICEKLPKMLIVISFPRAEKDNILLHGIVAHELGHVFCRLSKIDEMVVKEVDISRTEVEGLARDLIQIMESSGGSAGEEEVIASSPPTELEIRRSISMFMNSEMENWVKELCSDALGACLLGPAFFFSFIDLITSVQLLDNETPSHPPPRVRIKVITTTLEELGFMDSFKAKLPRSYLLFTKWKSEGDKESFTISPPGQVVLKAITRVVEKIVKYSIQCLHTKNPDWIYRGGCFNHDFDNLSWRLIHLIPPNEVLIDKTKETRPVEVISILNIGWAVNKDYFDEFSTNVKADDSKIDDYDCRTKLNKILLKALELSEAQMRWVEIQR